MSGYDRISDIGKKCFIRDSEEGIFVRSSYYRMVAIDRGGGCHGHKSTFLSVPAGRMMPITLDLHNIEYNYKRHFAEQGLYRRHYGRSILLLRQIICFMKFLDTTRSSEIASFVAFCLPFLCQGATLDFRWKE